ncbi:hypothetical protein Slin15195_G014960 [Septoria linicola]|uniref:Hydrophobin n=1 Tax=Septoria linicola TaxID=215465 RepID=A0A9Q9ALE7_9PEZI|nr:hypothetical protein Slin15195_G014960 [Septoria linicola]
MQFTTFVAVLASAALAASSALPVALPEIVTMPQGQPATVGAVCGQKQEKVACCNGGGSGGNGLLAGLNLFGGACSASILGDECSQGALACCPVSQSSPSLISVGSICAPISL